MSPASSRSLAAVFLSALIFCTASAALADVPQVLGYQGRVALNGVNIDGNAQFKFALVDAAGDVKWSNDGSIGLNVTPNTFVTLIVARGLYSVRLGDTAVTNMAAFPAGLFNNTDLRLRVWVNGGGGFQLLAPDQRFSSVAYALSAGTTQTLASGSVGSTQLASGLTLGGTTTGTFAGNIGSGATVTTASVVTATNLANAATDANTAGTLVKRDGSGNLSLGTITIAGNVNLPATSSSSVGVILQGGNRLLHTFGNTNFFAGRNAGNFTMTGNSNAAFGSGALSSNTTGSGNTAGGANALFNNTSGGSNTAYGSGALQANLNGGSNTATGSGALFANIAGDSNTAIGNSALNFNTIGSNNTATGNTALLNNTTASQNVAIGHAALLTQSFDNANVAWSSNNTAVGFQALKFNQPVSTSSGINNTAIGANTLRANTAGSGNTASGVSALLSNTIANANTASGESALEQNTTASRNIAIGYRALQLQSFSNAGVAWNSENTAVGFQALQSNQPTSTGNGISNTALGVSALQANTIGVSNTASGANALLANTTGNFNTAAGSNVLMSNTAGYNNTAHGASALTKNKLGNYNTAVGDSALFNNTNGGNNIAVGANAGYNLTTGGNNIHIGHAGVAAETDTIRIGTAGTQTKTFIAGILGAGVSGTQVVCDANGQLSAPISSRRYKEDIADMGDASARLQALRPVTFRYKKPYEDGEKPIQFGLIAEEVAESFPELAVLNAEGQPETVKYQDLAPLLLNEYLKEHRRVEEQQAALAQQKRQIETLETRLQELENRLPKPAATPQKAAARKLRGGARN